MSRDNLCESDLIDPEWIFKNGNKIHRTCVVPDNVEMGTGNVIYPYAVIGALGFIRDSEEAHGKVVIGDNNWIGAHSSIMVGQGGDTVIGDNNLLMNYTNIGHDVVIGSNNEIGAGSILGGWASIGSFNKVKLRCTIRNRATLGNHNIVGMGSLVTKPFPVDGKVIYGSPAKIIRNIE